MSHNNYLNSINKIMLIKLKLGYPRINFKPILLNGQIKNLYISILEVYIYIDTYFINLLHQKSAQVILNPLNDDFQNHFRPMHDPEIKYAQNFAICTFCSTFIKFLWAMVAIVVVFLWILILCIVCFSRSTNCLSISFMYCIKGWSQNFRENSLPCMRRR